MAKIGITLADVAEQCGLSHMSVSRALRGAPGVSPATTARIKAVATKMGYDPAVNHAARRMALQRYDQSMPNQVIALFFPRALPTSSYFVRLYMGVLDETEQRHFGLLTHYSDLFWETTSLPPLFQRGEVDGVIILDKFSSSGLSRHMSCGTPVGDRPIVTLIEPVPKCSAVLADDCLGGYLAASHLLQLGHRHLLHSAYADYPHQQRLLGFRRAYQDQGLEGDAYLHLCRWDNEGERPPAQVFLDYLRAHPEITGVLAPNDETALCMYRSLREAAILVPEQISLVGYDDAVPMRDRQQDTFLTTIAQPLELMGREAVRLLLRHLAEEEIGPRQIVLPVELVIRASTAMPCA